MTLSGIRRRPSLRLRLHFPGSGGGAAGNALFVAPTGDDANPGTMAQPLKTVAKARDLVRGMTATMTSDLTVYLRGGTYPQASTLTFGNADSGRNGSYVKYTAYQSEQPIITGGKPITGWATSSVGSGLYAASGVTTPFRQLYVNGVKAVRARAPNLGANGAAAFNRITGARQIRKGVEGSPPACQPPRASRAPSPVLRQSTSQALQTL